MDTPLRPPWEERLGADTTQESGQHEAHNPTIPGLTILGHPDPQRIGERVPLFALATGREVLLSRVEPQFAIPGGGPSLPLADPHLSRRPLRESP